jgi:hypothetical protein
MYRRITVSLPELVAQQLVAAADAERRDPRMQALVLIEAGLAQKSVGLTPGGGGIEPVLELVLERPG